MPKTKSRLTKEGREHPVSTLAQTISDEKYSVGVEIERSYKEFARSLFPSDRPLKVLDVGCGTGVNALELAKKGHHIVGVDISEVAIEKYRSNGFEGYQYDITKNFPFPDQEFEAVYASDVIEHLINTQQFLKEIHRVLMPGGIAVVSTINSAFWVFRLGSLLGKTVSDIQHPGHVRFFSKKSLHSSMADSGFESIQIAGRNMFCLLAGSLANYASPLLERIGFNKEIRFKTKKPFWHLSSCTMYANPFWADALIVLARKRK